MEAITGNEHGTCLIVTCGKRKIEVGIWKPKHDLVYSFIAGYIERKMLASQIFFLKLEIKCQIGVI